MEDKLAEARNVSFPDTMEIKAKKEEMLMNLLRSGARLMRHPKVSPEIHDARVATCEGCPSFKRDGRRCAECGCFVDKKAWLGGDPSTLCPLSKWV